MERHSLLFIFHSLFLFWFFISMTNSSIRFLNKNFKKWDCSFNSNLWHSKYVSIWRLKIVWCWLECCATCYLCTDCVKQRRKWCWTNLHRMYINKNVLVNFITKRCINLFVGYLKHFSRNLPRIFRPVDGHGCGKSEMPLQMFFEDKRILHFKNQCGKQYYIEWITTGQIMSRMKWKCLKPNRVSFVIDQWLTFSYLTITFGPSKCSKCHKSQFLSIFALWKPK